MKPSIQFTFNINHARLSVTTQYCGPTNTRGSRIAATARFGDEVVKRAYLSWAYDGKPSDNHDAAARLVLERWFEHQSADDAALGIATRNRIHLRLVGTPTANGKGYNYNVEQFDDAL
jgi:hypothetical protein